jgi:predicted transcriptional regulator of viral defense system
VAQELAVRPRRLRDRVLSEGRHVLDLDDVVTLTGLTRASAAAAMTRLRRSGDFFAPAKGLYAAIPPQYSSWGAIPATDFIDALMTKLDRRYYVALLSAAELHGAAHQRPQVFQVMVNKALPSKDFGRVHLRFYVNSRLDHVATEKRNTATGQMCVASAETTALDLANRPNDGGGLSNVATVLAELVLDGKVNATALADVAHSYPASAIRRLGWLCDLVSADADTSELAAAMERTLASRSAHGTRAVDLLDPSGPRRGPSDKRWGLVQNTEVEPDL